MLPFCIYVFHKMTFKQILIFLNSILLDEEGHIKITGQSIEPQNY